MKKLLSSVSTAALALCLILSSAQAMKRAIDDEEKNGKGIVTLQPGQKTENTFSGFETLHQELKFMIIWTSHYDIEILKSMAPVSKYYDNLINGQMLGKYLPLATMTNEDIQKCSWLVHLDLRDPEFIDCYGKKILPPIDPRNNKLITDNGIKFLTNLVSLYLPAIVPQSRRFTEDGITNLIHLRHLYLDGRFNERVFYLEDESDDDSDDPYRDYELVPPFITNKELKTFIHLTHLDLPFFEREEEWGLITDEGIKMLTNLKHLGLNTNHCITDKGIETLINLTSLDLTGTYKITNNGLRNLKKLTHLCLDEIEQRDTDPPPDITVEGIEGLKSLNSLSLFYNQSIKNNDIKKLTNLTRLILSKNETITNDGIKNLTNLTYLDICDNKIISDEGVRGLTNLTDLRVKHTINPITWSCVKNLINLTDLESIREKYAVQFTEECRAHAKDYYHLATEAIDVFIKREHFLKAADSIFTLSKEFPGQKTQEDQDNYKLYRDGFNNAFIEHFKKMDHAILGSM